MKFAVSWYKILALKSYTKSFAFGDIWIVAYILIYLKNYIYDKQQSNIFTNSWFYYFLGNHVSSAKFPLLLHMCYVSNVGNKRKIFFIMSQFMCVTCLMTIYNGTLFRFKLSDWPNCLLFDRENQRPYVTSEPYQWPIYHFGSQSESDKWTSTFHL